MDVHTPKMNGIPSKEARVLALVCSIEWEQPTDMIHIEISLRATTRFVY